MQLDPLKLSPDAVVLWFTFPDEITDDRLTESYASLLSPDEVRRCGRFVFARHRRDYIIARAVVRTVLGRCTGVDPRWIEFEVNAYGRPEMRRTEQVLPVRFNLSHTDGLIMFGVALDLDIGVDVEAVDRAGDFLEISERYFAPEENEALHVLAPEARNRRFMELWTLKESFMKACGLGFSMPLESFSFQLDADRAPRLRLSGPGASPARWSHRLLRPTPRHQAALTLGSDSGLSPNIVIRQLTPLVSERDLELRGE
jgi:4'-phosphopantetheinyl transferase